MRPAPPNAPRNRREMLEQWDNKVALIETPFFAQTVNHLPPATVDRDHPELGPGFSMGHEAGIRTWCFNSRSKRDRFLTYYRKVWSAAPCRNPRENMTANRIPKTAITERQLKKRMIKAAENAGVSLSDWARGHEITPQVVSAFMNGVQTPGKQIPKELGYRPQVIYIPLDEEPICNVPPPRQPWTGLRPKVRKR